MLALSPFRWSGFLLSPCAFHQFKMGWKLLADAKLEDFSFVIFLCGKTCTHDLRFCLAATLSNTLYISKCGIHRVKMV